MSVNMNCDLFRRSLLAYLRGGVPEPAFAAMVEHEGDCAECARLAIELNAEVEAPSFLETRDEPAAPDLAPLLDLTTGADCSYIEQRLGENLDEALSPDLSKLVETHLDACPSCQRLRDVIQDLPRWYATLPHVRPDHAFKRDVLRATLGPEPRFWEVVRALWRRPEAVWEAAVVCALITFVLFGNAVSRRVPDVDLVERASIHGVGGAVVRGLDDGASTAGRIARAPYTLVRDAFTGLHSYSARVSSYMERVVTEVRTGDYEALLRDLRIVLEPIGLYPDDANTDPTLDTNAPAGGAPADSGEPGAQTDGVTR